MVAFDILFDRPAADAGGDEELAAALSSTNSGVLAMYLQPITRMDAEMRVDQQVELKLPVAPLAAASRALGFVNIGGPGEEASVISACRLAHEHQGRRLESLPQATARAWGHAGEADGRERWIRYVGTCESKGMRRLELADIVKGRADPGELSQVPVLVGATAAALGDVKETPVGAMPGVEVNANILMDVLWAGFLEPLEPLDVVGLVGVSAALAALVLALAPGRARVLGFGGLGLLVAALAVVTAGGRVAASGVLAAALPVACLLPAGRRSGDAGLARAALDRGDAAAATEELGRMGPGEERDALAMEVLLAAREVPPAERLFESLALERVPLPVLYRLGRAFESRSVHRRARELYGAVQRRDIAFLDASERFLVMDALAVSEATVLGIEGVVTTLAAAFDAVERVGSGASGLLFRCREPETGETVAVKVLDPRLLADGTAMARFRREAGVLERLSHPGIVRFRGATYGKLCYYRMDFVEGQSLAELAAGGWRPSESDGRSVLEQAASALAHAHDAGVLHRDLKPSNLMRTPDGRIVVVDFGVARLEGATRLTREGTFVGTMQFAAPEQLRGEPVDARVDIYALGAVLRYLAGPELARWSIAPLIERMIAEAPGDRPASMREVGGGVVSSQ